MKDQADIQMDQAELAMDAKKEQIKMKDARQANRLKTGVDLLNSVKKDQADKLKTGVSILNTVKKDKAKDKPETKPKG